MSVYEEIDSAARESIKDELQRQAEQGVRDRWAGIEDPAGVVSGRIPASPAQALGRDLGRRACRRWARGAGPQGAVADATYRPFCEEYLDDIGELPEAGEYGKDYEGGQCPTTYLVSLANTSPTVPTPTTAQAFAIGPVTGAYSTPGINPGTRFWFVNANPDVNFRTADEGEDWSITSVQRFDGSPDNCGSIPDGYKPTAYIPDDGGGREPIVPPGFPPITIDIGPDGGIDIDFPGLGGPGRTVDEPFLPRKPDDYGPQPEPPPPPGDRGEPDTPVDVDPGGDAEGADPSRVLVGLSVELTNIAPNARVSFLGGAPFYSYAYSVMMGGDGGVERDNESAFAPADAFYHAPENSNRYSVAFRNGFGGRVIPYWQEIQEE